MNKTQALKEARKRFGKQAIVQSYPHPSSPENREAAKAECATHSLIPKEQRDKDWRIKHSEIVSRCCYYRCSVGRLELGMFNAIQGQGDNFEEAFEAADCRAAA